MNTVLWNNIRNFDVDDPVSEYGFSTRLASENFWTTQFTSAAILEYKKFMYLAASSVYMVSPSETVDTVWHQHLIFTESYTEFCTVLGKQVQHIPSTHNRKEYEKFRQAKERTTTLYRETFGEQPKEIWEYEGMYESLHLAKAGINIRSFILLGILAFILLLFPAYLLLKPVYLQINNPYFINVFIILSAVSFIALEVYNRSRLAATLKNITAASFIFKLTPVEVIYMKTQKLSNVIHTTMNKLMEKKVVKVHNDYSIEHTSHLKVDDIEEHQLLDTLHQLGRTKYPALVKKSLTKPVFNNVSNCIDALKKYHIKSKSFGNLFYLNFSILATLLLQGAVRLSTGILRNKPITIICITLIVLTILTAVYLWRLTKLFLTKTVPDFYRQEIIPSAEDDPQWRYFLMGTAALAVPFVPLVQRFNKINGSTADSSMSSCGTSCSSCGSSCGGCGGD